MIKFWKTLDKWGEFSNFYRFPVTINGKEWKSTEHYYQAMKFIDPKIQQHIADQTIPRLAADEGRRTDFPLRADWETVKDDVMRIALRAKFSNPELRYLLLSTGDEKIVEDSPTDPYWGVGKDGSGKNMLGILLMELREQLRYEMTLSKEQFDNIKTTYASSPAVEAIHVRLLLDHLEVLQSEVDYWRARY